MNRNLTEKPVNGAAGIGSAEPVLIQRERAVLHDLIALASARAAGEKSAETDFAARNEAAENQYQEVRQRIAADFQAVYQATEAEYQRIRHETAAHFDADYHANEAELAATSRRLTGPFGKERESLETHYQETRWTTTTLHEANKTKVDAQFQEFGRRIAAHLQKIVGIRQQAARDLAAWIDPQAPVPSGSSAAGTSENEDQDILRDLKERITGADAHLAQSQNLILIRVLKGKRFAAAVILIWILSVSPAAYLSSWYWFAIGTLAVALIAFAFYCWFRLLARKQVKSIYEPLCQALADAEVLCRKYQAQVTASHTRQLARGQERHDTGIRQAEETYQFRLAEITERRDTGLRQAEEKHHRRLDEINQRRDNETRVADAKCPALLADVKKRYEYDSYHVYDRYQRQLSESKHLHKQDWSTLAQNWQQGLARLQAAVTDIGLETRRLFPVWDSDAWKNWRPPTTVPPVIRFGEFQIALARIQDGISQAEPLKGLGPIGFVLPALLHFPARCSVLFKAAEDGRAQAEQALQLIMLRLLTGLPPAKARFTIIDPVGLGQSFSAFMHLADYEEAMVSSRIWTEHQHIELRLADLTAHMENVIQKFLRNQYQSIEEYNAHAGEVAEPFRFLVVANFPANFTPEAVRRLVSVAASGARCGVHTLITVDTRLPLPQGFDLKDLEQHAVCLVWTDGKFAWNEPEFGRFPFQLDDPPGPDFTTSILQIVGQTTKEASRVEVPFEFIAPAPQAWWTGDSRLGVQVPLGRSGATKRQQLTLGQGTAQHVLIAGKTGSGKSTLLHALITNIGLLYRPDEIELYLVDFKEGVEFKAYATHELPHARLVAIESEREFGLSVLQRLDTELKQRGDRFRAAGVQDLGAYRQAVTGPLPRILLIVDEFQLFFIEDDKIAQEAALLLDRLVRQGRAFGIHVLLGSQTLGGAYSLARSTIGQMAVRIALQCSETDAHLILSDDNPAARLLSRPGEAIYNDANGLVEGNDFFQVVWLPDELREEYLIRIQDLARQEQYVPPQPQIVFEGKAPADVAKNHLLDDLLSAPSWPVSTRQAQAWLGEAMAIKDPTAAAFRLQSGCNLLMIGQFEAQALAIMATSLISLAAQHLPASEPARAGSACFHLLDGSSIDSPNADFLSRVAGIIPHPVKVGGWRDLPSVVGELAAEVDRRLKDHDTDAPSQFLFIYSLHRFRDLRRQEEDFSFSRRGEERPPNPSKQFATILRDGPAVGIYTLVWCDTLNNVNRTIDRQGLREFEMRVLFQMSAADSSNLIDSPVASKLGPHRALFYSEDRGHPEKFRPYGLPSESWLAWAKEQFFKRLPIPAKSESEAV